MPPIRRTLAIAAVAATALAPVAAAPPAAAVPFCGIQWGSLPKVTGYDTAQAPITNVRAGRHRCFDRVVVDVSGPAGEYAVRYVGLVREPGSGRPVPLRGGARLEVVVGSPTYDAAGNTVYDPANRRHLVATTGFRTLRQVALAGSFESQTVFGIGVRARLPMRVFTVNGPGAGQRLVIDVAHRW